MQLEQRNTLPDGLLDAKPDELHGILPNPTLLHLSGKRAQPLFISVLQHGNEPTGFLALQTLLKKYQSHDLPRSISIYFGNTLAASQSQRHLANQPDFNRIWPGTECPATPESRIAREIVAIMKQKHTFASIDIHNNTGLNPHYACINQLNNRFLQLASFFSRLIVYFTRPKGVQSAAFAKLCPAVTLECGKPGQKYGVEHAFDFLDTILHLPELSDKPVNPKNIDLFHTVARVKINDNIDFSFQNQTSLMLNTDLEWMNFTEIPPGTPLGKVNQKIPLPLTAINEHGHDVSSDYFSINNLELQINRQTMPSMLTLDEQVIRQDCLCYLMERIQL
jgi:succinylglutamate desuccinylase